MVLREHRERQERGSLELHKDVKLIAQQMSSYGRQIERIEKSFNERIAALTSSQRQLEQAVLQGVEGGAK